MYVLEITNILSPIENQLLGMLGFSRAHVILWQNWGSCGEHAIVTAYLLHKFGYNVRTAHFNDIDHSWAEVYVNRSWYIVDPWYIGIVYEKEYHSNKYLVPANNLASLKNFVGNHKVLCVLLNNEEIDCTKEHGYHEKYRETRMSKLTKIMFSISSIIFLRELSKREYKNICKN